MSTRVDQWKHLDRLATEHMSAFGVVGSHKPCAGCDADTCTYVTELSRQMRQLYARMTADERQQC